MAAIFIVAKGREPRKLMSNPTPKIFNKGRMGTKIRKKTASSEWSEAYDKMTSSAAYDTC
ncbi:MAG: hypothetical protein HOP10_07660 [Chitinophagaceae bacterium]|nr:hypothetical protein [Chitinophagaceae bacterium]